MEDILEYVQFSDKNKTLETIQKQQEQEQQQQQQLAQAQMEAARVDNETKMGFAAAQQAQAQERMGKIQLDKAEAIGKLEKSETDKVEAVLKLILAAKEIEGADIDQIQKVMALMQGQEQHVQGLAMGNEQLQQMRSPQPQESGSSQSQQQAA
jgi:hypothetical protein